MDIIPITFTSEGNTHTGTFNKIAGAGSTAVFHLMIDNYYCGRLRMAGDNWFFDPTPKTEPFKTLAEEFGNYVVAWVG